MRMRSLLLAVGACLATLALTAGAALADPVPPIPPDRVLAGVGSDTTQDVMNGFANGAMSVPAFGGIKDASGNFVVSSFDAVGSATITTHPTAACTNIPRPNGSGAGANALDADTSGCIQFSRSSSATIASAHPNDTFVPFAQDSLPFGTNTVTNVPKTLTTAQLTAIYSRNTGNCLFHPFLPQSGSGTRSAWLSFIGVGGAGQPPLGSCVSDIGNTLEEHDCRPLVGDADAIFPFSAAQFVSQTTDAMITDRHGFCVLRAVNKIAWNDPTFPFIRQVFNVVRTADLNANPPTAISTAINSTFVGAGSAVCSHPEVTRKFGFTPLTGAACGTTTLVN